MHFEPKASIHKVEMSLPPEWSLQTRPLRGGSVKTAGNRNRIIREKIIHSTSDNAFTLGLS